MEQSLPSAVPPLSLPDPPGLPLPGEKKKKKEHFNAFLDLNKLYEHFNAYFPSFVILQCKARNQELSLQLTVLCYLLEQISFFFASDSIIIHGIIRRVAKLRTVLQQNSFS